MPKLDFFNGLLVQQHRQKVQGELESTPLGTEYRLHLPSASVH